MADAKYENQIRNVFDSIDDRRLGHAESQLNQLESKHSNEHRFLAAKALIELQNGAHDRAEGICRRLAAENVTHPMALPAVTHVMQNLALWDLLLKTYQRILPLSSDANAVNENIAMTYVRMKDFAAAQRAFTALYKATRQPDYLVRQVMANVASIPKEEQQDHLGMKLAAKFLDAQILSTAPSAEQSRKITAETTALYVDVLRRQNRNAECLAFLQSARGAAVGTRADRLCRIMDVRRALGDLLGANAMAVYLLQCADCDNWDYLTTYVETLAEMLQQAKNKDGGEAAEAAAAKKEKQQPPVVLSLEEEDEFPLEGHSTLAKAREFAQDLIGINAESPRRGPHLLYFMLCSRSGKIGEGFPSEDDRREVFKAYLSHFGEKPACFLDLVKYVQDEPSLADYFESLKVTEGSASSSALVAAANDKAASPASVEARKAAARNLTLDTLSTFLRSAAQRGSDERTFAVVQRSVQQYLDCTRRLTSGLQASEENPYDGFLIVAINACVRRFVEVAASASSSSPSDDASSSAKWLFLGLALTRLSTNRDANPAILLFSMLFATKLNVDDSESLIQMDFKSVQYDSMLHLALFPLLRTGSFAAARRVAGQSDKWFLGFDKETAALLARCFQQCTYSRVEGLMDFRDRVLASTARAEAHLHNALLSLSADCETMQELRGAVGRAARVLEPILRRPAGEFQSNADRSLVLGALIHEDPGSEYADKLCEAMVPLRELSERVKFARGVAVGVLCLADLLALNEREKHSASSSASGNNKSKRGSATAAAATEAAAESDHNLVLRSASDDAKAAAASIPHPGARAAVQSLIAIVDAKAASNGQSLSSAAMAFIDGPTEAWATIEDAVPLCEAVYPVLPMQVAAIRILADAPKASSGSSSLLKSTIKPMAQLLSERVAACQEKNFPAKEMLSEAAVEALQAAIAVGGEKNGAAESAVASIGEAMKETNEWLLQRGVARNVRVAQYLDSAFMELASILRRK